MKKFLVELLTGLAGMLPWIVAVSIVFLFAHLGIEPSVGMILIVVAVLVVSFLVMDLVINSDIRPRKDSQKSA